MTSFAKEVIITCIKSNGISSSNVCLFVCLLYKNYWFFMIYKHLFIGLRSQVDYIYRQIGKSLIGL